MLPNFMPSNEHTFHFSAVGDKSKAKYEGAFKIKCLLTTAEDIEVKLRYDSYVRGSLTVDQSAATRARAIAELEMRVIDAPIWFKDSNSGRELLDKNIVLELALKVMNEGEDEFDKRIAEKAKKDEEALEAAAAKKEKKSEKK